MFPYKAFAVFFFAKLETFNKLSCGENFRSIGPLKYEIQTSNLDHFV